MCNGTGLVRVRPISEVPRYLFDLNRIPVIIYSKINKNEYQLLTKGVVNNLRTHDYRRAATAFNHLISLTVGSQQESEKDLHNKLLRVKHALLNGVINPDEADEADEDLSLNDLSSLEKMLSFSDHLSRIKTLERKFEEIYSDYFLVQNENQKLKKISEVRK